MRRRHRRDSPSHAHSHHNFGYCDRNTQCRKAFQPTKAPTKVQYRQIRSGEEMASSMNPANKEMNPRDQQYAISLASRNRPNNDTARTYRIPYPIVPNNRYRTTSHIIALCPTSSPSDHLSLGILSHSLDPLNRLIPMQT